MHISTPPSVRKPINLPKLIELYVKGEKITMLTAYDSTFASVADRSGIECLLVGDSLGMVCQGLKSTVSVSLNSRACKSLETRMNTGFF